MIYDLLEVFSQAYTEKGDKLILDNYQLKEGLYVKINTDETIEYYLAQTVKKEKTFSTIEGNINHTMHEWFKERDYYSGYLNSNKSFYDKKIHNVNYLSLFIKLESFITTDPKKVLNPDVIKYHYKALCDYKKFTKSQEIAIIKTFQNELTTKTRRKDILKKYRFVEKHIHDIVAIAQEKGVSNYLKLFFEADIERYKRESNYYYAIKIFNDIGYSQKIDDKMFGLSDSNMGLNAKKPYLEHKTRRVINKQTIIAPFMIKQDDALMIKKFFDWLKFQEYPNKYPLGDQFFLNRDVEKKDIVVDFDYLPIKIDRLPHPITVTNYLNMTSKKVLVDDFSIDTLAQLEAVVDETLYNHQLIYNYYGEVYKKLDTRFANLIYMTRDAMVNYFRKYDAREFYTIIHTHGFDFVTEHLRQDREYKAKESMNLILSLKHHQGEAIMDIKKMQEQVLQKLETSDYSDINEEEFFYLCGQVAKYLLSQSEAHTKNADMLEPYLRCNNAQKLKKSIEADFFKYKHKIPLGYVKFGNALSIIMSYDKEEKLSYWMDSFLVGVLSQNIFYMKKEKEGEE